MTKNKPKFDNAYIILTAENAVELVKLVNATLAHGYVPLGGAVISCGTVDGLPYTEYCQTVMKAHPCGAAERWLKSIAGSLDSIAGKHGC